VLSYAAFSGAGILTLLSLPAFLFNNENAADIEAINVGIEPKFSTIFIIISSIFVPLLIKI